MKKNFMKIFLKLLLFVIINKILFKDTSWLIVFSSSLFALVILETIDFFINKHFDRVDEATKKKIDEYYKKLEE